MSDNGNMGSSEVGSNGQQDAGTANNLFPSTRVEAMAAEDQQATTHNITGGDSVQTTIMAEKLMSISLRNSASTGVIQDIKTFLGKPVTIASGNLQSTDTVSTFSKFYIPQDLISDSMIAKKIEGFYGFRATTCFKLQINGNRFQQGRYMLYYLPTGGNLKATSNIDNYGQYDNMHCFSLVQRTQLPRIELDVVCDSEGVLKIPFISGETHWPLVASSTTKRYSTLGHVQITPYSALEYVAGSALASYTLWTWFEDVELVSPMIPQSGYKSKSEREADSVGAGPISSALTKVSRSAAILAEIPMLDSLASPVSWVSDVLSRSAAVFGLSKPVDFTKVTRTKRTVMNEMHNWEGVDDTKVIAFSKKNELAPCIGIFGSNVDQMSIDFIKTIPAWYRTATWTTARDSGYEIFADDVYPNVYAKTFSDDGISNVYAYPPVTYLSKFFSYWRGGLKYKIKLVKTEFHSGRFMIAFSPFDSRTPPALYPTLATSRFVHREIIDIRAGNEFTFTIPFVSTKQWNEYDQPIGSFHVIVVDKLVAPATVPDNVKFLVEVCGADDMQFAFPANNNYMTPYIPSAPQSGYKPASEEINPCEITETTIGGNTQLNSSMPALMSCIGEKVTSLRQLLKIYSELRYKSLPTLTTEDLTTVIPHALPVVAYASTGVYTTPDVLPDWFTAVGCCYAMMRGSVRFKMVGKVTTGGQVNAWTNSSNLVHVTINQGFTNTSNMIDRTATTSTTRNNNRLGLNSWNSLDLEQGLELSIPHYDLYPTKNTCSYLTSTGSSAVKIHAGNNAYVDSGPRLLIFHPTGWLPMIYRAIGDDFSFGYFVSTPPIIPAVVSTM